MLLPTCLDLLLNTMLVKPALLHFKFDEFAYLPTEVDNAVESEVQTDCNGNEWMLVLFPGGQSDSNEGWVSLYINYLGGANNDSLDTAYSLDIKDANGTVYDNEDDDQLLEAGNNTWGYHDYLERAEIVDPNNNILKDGALCIDLTIQVKPSLRDDLYGYNHRLTDKMRQLLESGERSDATFIVGDETFKVHSCIIHNNAPVLANQLNQNAQNPDNVIEGILPEVFRLVLMFVYTEFCPSWEEINVHAKELIDAANRYELIELKVDVENVLVRERIMNRENVSDWILFADAHSCALLKEYALSYFLLHSTEILKSEHSKRLRESGEVLSEIIMLMADGDGGITVTELRKQLGKRDLDVDGSKETLAARLEIAKRQRTDG
eukprot:scaffold96769_cov63-Cyclotella_meneghiniana.AAC.5